jgi:hypothetical protein
LIEGHEPSIELADEHLAVAESDTAARPPAADRVVLGSGRAYSRGCSRLDTDSEHVVGTGDDVDHPS